MMYAVHQAHITYRDFSKHKLLDPSKMLKMDEILPWKIVGKDNK